MDKHVYYMQFALREAEKALEEDEVPVGTVIVHNDKIIARAHNQREMLKDPTAHAEMIAITQASAHLENWRLSGATIYVTLEPCLMCLAALREARVDALVFGAWDNKNNGEGSSLDLFQKFGINQKLEVVPGVMELECREILQGFFSEKRLGPDRYPLVENET